jgi:hypothetical protein
MLHRSEELPKGNLVVDSDLVSVWQLYPNQHMMHKILERNRAV